jgi:DNA end-binding protein Ku
VELAEIAIESTHTVEIEKFVPKASSDDRYRDTPYYLAPEDKVGQGDPRCHEEEDGRYRARRDCATRAHHDAGATRQGHSSARRA